MKDAATKSWQTTAAGWTGALAVFFTELQKVLDNDPTTVAEWGLVIAAVSVAMGFTAARDNNVSSEEAVS